MNATAAVCAHCGLPAAPMTDPASRSFCCAGCRAVWHALHDAGLGAYYDLAAAEASPATHSPARVTGRGFEHLDGAEFLATHVRASGGSLASRLRVDGLHCGACVWLLEALPGVVPGLRSVRVLLGDSAIDLEWDAQTSLSSIASSLDRLGYQVGPLDLREVATFRRAYRRDLLEMGVAGAMAVNAMGLAFALYGAHFASMDPAMREFVQWWSVALATAAVAWPGRQFFRNAITSVRARVPHMDIPVAFGLASALVASIVATARGIGSIYAEGVAMLVFLLLVGRFVQRAAQRKALGRIETAMALLPATARRVTDLGTEDISIEALRVGDVILVPAHESVGADGTLLDQCATFDRSHLTGESRPQECRSGDWVEAGSRCLTASATIQVCRGGAAPRAAQIGELVRQAAASRAPICQLADRLAGWFLVAVLVLAGACAAWWTPRLGWDTAMERTVALLVVTCPCALGLATPLAVLAGIGSAARRGVLVKSGETLERLGRAGTLILDKTGTLTSGLLRVTAMTGDVDALQLAAAVDRHSSHPAARAIVDAANAAGAKGAAEAAVDIMEVPGEGIAGSVQGRQIVVGNVRALQRHGLDIRELRGAPSPSQHHSLFTHIGVAVDGDVRLVITLGDQVRPESADTISSLRRAGWHILLASGDDPRVARAIGRQVGLQEREVFGGLSPEEKLELVRDARLPRPVVMVGDGINDLAALAAADCGVAVRGGAQSASRTADACLAAEGLTPLVILLESARRTMRTIRLNLGLSLAYNAVGAAAAFAGLVNPIVASILMPLSGLTVLATSLSLARARAGGTD